MNANPKAEDGSEVPADVAGKSAEQIEDILAMIDSGELKATSRQRAYLAGAAYALREQAKLNTTD